MTNSMSVESIDARPDQLDASVQLVESDLAAEWLDATKRIDAADRKLNREMLRHRIEIGAQLVRIRDGKLYLSPVGSRRSSTLCVSSSGSAASARIS